MYIFFFFPPKEHNLFFVSFELLIRKRIVNQIFINVSNKNFFYGMINTRYTIYGGFYTHKIYYNVTVLRLR